MDSRPIALFDSGLGGLTVLQKINELLPNENIIYFGDTARVPYGSKSKDTIIRYSREIVNFLIRNNVKLIVIACGTASSLAYDTLIKEFNIPIINVIHPTAKALKDKTIGVIATNATIRSNAWEKEIKKYNPNCTVYSRSCPLFVPIVEEGLAKHKIADEAIELYLRDLVKRNIESIVLGCTHYPVLIEKIKAFVGKNVKTINMNEYCAKEVKRYLTEKNLLNTLNARSYKIAYVTDNVATFKANADIFCNVDFDKVSKIYVDRA